MPRAAAIATPATPSNSVFRVSSSRTLSRFFRFCYFSTTFLLWWLKSRCNSISGVGTVISALDFPVDSTFSSPKRNGTRERCHYVRDARSHPFGGQYEDLATRFSQDCPEIEI